MSFPEVTSRREGISTLLRSYAADLRGWAAKLAAGYAIAVVILVGAVLALFAAIAVGITALFHLIEHHYGTDIAFGSIGGGLLILAIVLFLTAWLMLRWRTRLPPRPRRQLQAAKRGWVGSTALSAIRRLSESEAVKADPKTELLIGAAVAMLVGWIVASRLRSPSQHQVQR
jgi:uncharacterized membrane protein YedE/YeeE